MKTAKDLFERLNADEAFGKEFTEALQKNHEAGAKDNYESFLRTAQEYGYSASREDLDEMLKSLEGDLTEEELGKVAGGTVCASIMTFILSVAVGTAVTASLRGADVV